MTIPIIFIGMISKPILVPLSGQMALKIIRDAAADSSRVFLTHHANARMRERRITLTQVLRCLQKGRLSEGPAPDTMKGGWKCTVAHYTSGEKIGVAVGIESAQADGIVVITVFHVD